jgi:hypothetical protein
MPGDWHTLLAFQQVIKKLAYHAGLLNWQSQSATVPKPRFLRARISKETPLRFASLPEGMGRVLVEWFHKDRLEANLDAPNAEKIRERERRAFVTVGRVNTARLLDMCGNHG